MSEQYGSFRFGPDAPSRIAGTAVVLQEASELLPGEPMYQPLIPFYPVIVSGDGTSTGAIGTTSDGFPIWGSYPTRVDLQFYQGDDVVIPLYFNDPTLVGDDMEQGFTWFAQIRRVHSYKSTLLANLAIDATYHSSAVDDPALQDEYTMVEMYLPRALNDEWGYFQWEIASQQVKDMSRFPKPEGYPEDSPWPEVDVVRTWLYGKCTILPRTTTTDVLPPTTPGITTLGAKGWVLTPNGAIGGSVANPSVGIDIYGHVDVVPQ